MRKCVVFYSALASEKAPDRFSFDPIMELPSKRITNDLLPVLRHGEPFDLKSAKETVVEYLRSLLLPEKSNEIEFWKSFNKHKYRPELLFSDE